VYQAKVLPGSPVAVKVVGVPAMMLALDAVTVGVGITVMVTSSVAVHPFQVYNTLYIVVVFGLTVIEGVV
jgi:hypothetical protein